MAAGCWFAVDEDAAVGEGDLSRRLSIASADERRLAGRRSDGGGGGGLTPVPFSMGPPLAVTVNGAAAITVGLNAAARTSKTRDEDR